MKSFGTVQYTSSLIVFINTMICYSIIITIGSKNKYLESRLGNRLKSKTQAQTESRQEAQRRLDNRRKVY